jgi:hypothetical protein
MIAKGFFSHISPDGEASGARLKRSATSIVPPARTSPGGLPPRAPRTTSSRTGRAAPAATATILNENFCEMGMGAAKGEESYANATMRPPTGRTKG